MLLFTLASGKVRCNVPIYHLFENLYTTSASLSEPTYHGLPPHAALSSHYLCKLPGGSVHHTASRSLPRNDLNRSDFLLNPYSK